MVCEGLLANKRTNKNNDNKKQLFRLQQDKATDRSRAWTLQAGEVVGEPGEGEGVGGLGGSGAGLGEDDTAQCEGASRRTFHRAPDDLRARC